MLTKAFCELLIGQYNDASEQKPDACHNSAATRTYQIMEKYTRLAKGNDRNESNCKGEEQDHTEAAPGERLFVDQFVGASENVNNLQKATQLSDNAEYRPLQRTFIDKKKQNYSTARDVNRESYPAIRPRMQKKATVQITEMPKYEKKDKSNGYLS